MKSKISRYKKPLIKAKKLKSELFSRRSDYGDSYNMLLETSILAYPGCGCSCRSG